MLIGYLVPPGTAPFEFDNMRRTPFVLVVCLRVTYYTVLRPRKPPSLGGSLEGGVTGDRPILFGLPTCDFDVHGGALRAAHDVRTQF